MGDSRTLQVGDWAVLPAQNMLELDGTQAQIESRAMEVLVYLADHPGEVISSEELIRVVWKGRVVGDGSVYRAINHLRQALGDSSQDAQFIQTVPKRGYRLIATVRSSTNARDARDEIRSIAVLPFVNMSPEPEQEYFSDGITEEILNALAHVPGLRVAARTSAFSFKGTNVDVRSVGEKLNVQHVLEGSVRKSGNRLRITSQLISVEDGFHLWSESYDRELTDVFSVQDEIARTVVDKLRIELGLVADEPLVRISTTSLDAYNWYLRGKFALLPFTPEATEESIACLQRAIRIDPSYADAHGYLTFIYMSQQYYKPWQVIAPAVRQSYESALASDPRHSAALVAKAYDCLRTTWNWDEANRLLLEARPKDHFSESWLFAYVWNYLWPTGQVEEALALLLEAEQADPFNLEAKFQMGFILSWTGHLKEAQEKFLQVLGSAPQHSQALVNIGAAYAMDNNCTEAERYLRRLEDIGGSAVYPFVMLTKGLIYRARDDEKGLRDLIEEGFEVHANDPNASSELLIQIAELHYYLGEEDEFARLQLRAFEEGALGSAWMKTLIARCPIFDKKLASHPRMVAMFERMNQL